MKQITILTASSSQQVALLDVSNLFAGVPLQTHQRRPGTFCFIIFFAVCWFAHPAFGAPFLVCDPVTPGSDSTLNPVSYVVSGLTSNPVTTPAIQNADGSLQLKYDLAQLANGKYTVSAVAVNSLGTESSSSAPLNFTKGAPATPTNLRISPN